jgi:hypothetical protein
VLSKWEVGLGFGLGGFSLWIGGVDWGVVCLFSLNLRNPKDQCCNIRKLGV